MRQAVLDIKKTSELLNTKKCSNRECGDYDTRTCNRLTDAHIYENKMKKMKVKYATQVFSQRLSA